MSDETSSASPEALAQDFKKDELAAAAEVHGVEVKSKDTKADIATKLAGAMGSSTVQVNQYNRRHGDEPLFGSWVDVVAGEHAGRRGHYHHDVSHAADGYPERVLVRSRDADNLDLEVNYSDIRPANDFRGGR